MMSRTSTEVKRRYNDSVYSKIQCELPKDTVAAFKEKCKKTGISQASVILEAIEAFLQNDHEIGHNASDSQ